MSKRFPLPSKEFAQELLECDMCYRKIRPQDRQPALERAWKTGQDAARELYTSTGGNTNFFDLAKQSGVEVIMNDCDQVIGHSRYFSEYQAGKKTITLYLGSIALWARANALEQEVAQNLLLAHEYFHFLETTKLGLTSKQVLVYIIRLGGFEFGHTGVRALSEIAAQAFIHTYFYDVIQAAKERQPALDDSIKEG